MDIIRPDPGALAEAAADWIATTLAALPGRLAVSLSGGSTPKRLYETLVGPGFIGRMPWDRIHWFWGDERFVATDDPRSNTAMVRGAMLDHAPVPPGHIHPVPTAGLTPQAAADAYGATLHAFQAEAPERPLFDLVLLGLGTNGHTASLFPGEPAVDERTAWAAPVAPPGEPIRITLTWPPLEDTRHAAFLVAGADKAEMVARTRAHDLTVVAARYAPRGELHWWLDQSAA